MTRNERSAARIGADAQLGRRHTTMAWRVVPSVPRDALVDRAARLERLAVQRCCPPSHLPPEAIRRENEPDEAPHARRDDTDPLFRQAGMRLDNEG
jgi:hypothetical protein